jgi:hypothetical protein
VVVVVAATVVPASADAAVHPFATAGVVDPPHRVVVLGDSTALTLGYALAATAPHGTTVVNGGLYGCGLAVASWTSNAPPVQQLSMFPACNESTPASGRWPALDAQAVRDTAAGDVVLFVAGTWEVQDLLRQGRWDNLTQPSFRRYELGQLRTLVRIAGVHGAHVDLATMPATGSSDASPEAARADSTARRLIYDRLLQTTASAFPGRVSIVDYGDVLSPHGVFHQYLDGVEVRAPDGIHTPVYAPGNVFAGNATEGVAHAFYDWISPRIWPLLEASVPSR